MASKHAWKIDVSVPQLETPGSIKMCDLDFFCELLKDQRVACGWRADEVPEWVECAERGGRMFYWAVLAEDLPDRNALLERHIASHPEEKEYLRDTANTIRLAPRQPTGRAFVPVGHVALDIHDAEEDAKLGLPPSTVWVHQLYISSALQGGGFGAATMAKIENVAAQEPMNGVWMALDTLAKEVQKETGDGTDVGTDSFTPVTSKEEWYAHLGYQTYKQGPGYTYQTPDGHSIQLRVSYMKKRISGRI